VTAYLTVDLKSPSPFHSEKLRSNVQRKITDDIDYKRTKYIDRLLISLYPITPP